MSSKNPNQQFYYKSNRLQQLRGFCYTVQFGNISKAADYMGLTHSTVSVQIKSLEEELGVDLLTRNGPSISISANGRAFYEMAVVHIDGINKLYDNFRQKMTAVSDTSLAIAANSTVIQFILPSLMRSYLHENQHVYVTVHFAEYQEALEKIYDDKVDMAVLPRREHLPFPESIHYIPVFYYQPALITLPDHPLAGRANLTVEEISRYELSLASEELRVIPNLYDIFPQHNMDRKMRINFVNWETTRQYIEQGLTISISGDMIIQPGDKLVATPLTHLFPSVDYGFVLRRDQEPPEKITRLIRLARELEALRHAMPV